MNNNERTKKLVHTSAELLQNKAQNIYGSIESKCFCSATITSIIGHITHFKVNIYFCFPKNKTKIIYTHTRRRRVVRALSVRQNFKKHDIFDRLADADFRTLTTLTKCAAHNSIDCFFFFVAIFEFVFPTN